MCNTSYYVYVCVVFTCIQTFPKKRYSIGIQSNKNKKTYVTTYCESGAVFYNKDITMYYVLCNDVIYYFLLQVPE